MGYKEATNLQTEEFKRMLSGRKDSPGFLTILDRHEKSCDENIEGIKRMQEEAAKYGGRVYTEKVLFDIGWAEDRKRIVNELREALNPKKKSRRPRRKKACQASSSSAGD